LGSETGDSDAPWVLARFGGVGLASELLPDFTGCFSSLLRVLTTWSAELTLMERRRGAGLSLEMPNTFAPLHTCSPTKLGFPVLRRDRLGSAGLDPSLETQFRV
jgi:hypothetical protein